MSLFADLGKSAVRLRLKSQSCFSFLCSDPAVKQFLLHLDEKVILGKKFVIDDLDETHLFVSAEIVPVLQEKVWEIMDNNSFNTAQVN